ncbi:Uncharacterized protein RNJ44_02086 [Nakaseomyces bracarensis]|uniref:Protein kinase domain-containing protein n=1 Tax=Nakaseomyces bracarensis TaxID=273131 RepID=A0ABR4NMM4_9SACH
MIGGLGRILGTNDNILNKDISSGKGSVTRKVTITHGSIKCDNFPRTLYKNANFSVPGKYEIVQILGKGSYGVVCAARLKNPMYQDREFNVAVKKIINIFYREILLKRAIREIKFLSYFKGHKNIVNLLDLEIVVEKPYDGLYCYQELVDYDLGKVIHSSVQLSDFHIQNFTYQILCGLKYIHSADVIHRDLKPGNILCTVNGCLKICDFGLARGISKRYLSSNSKPSDITNYVATRWYRAPELILSNQEYDKSIDMWAVGCILAEFYGRKPIFMGKDSMNQVYQIVKILGTPPKKLLIKFGTIKAWNLFGDNVEGGTHNMQSSKLGVPWSTVYPMASEEALDLIDKLLQWDNQERLTVTQAIEHPFLQVVRKANDEPICTLGPFDFSYERSLNSMENLRNCLFNEIKQFNLEKTIRETNSIENYCA